jgi:RimJ/RimL family protein N-acetyltransferase
MNLERMVADAAHFRLESKRLVLRRLTDADIPTAIAHEQERRIMHWIRDPQPLAAIEARVRSTLEPWRAAEGQWLLLAVQQPSDELMIGVVCCRVVAADTETMEIGYRFHVDVQRRGFGLEATRALVDYLFGTIAVRKLVAFCVSDNEPSWRLMDKLGMTREATFREYSHLAGAWRDEYVYGLLRREWPART